MRIRLKQLQGKRHAFLAYVQAFSYNSRTRICLENIRLKTTGELVTDHVWVVGDWIADYRINVGDIIAFTAQARRYLKLNHACNLKVYDFGFSKIRDVEKI